MLMYTGVVAGRMGFWGCFRKANQALIYTLLSMRQEFVSLLTTVYRRLGYISSRYIRYLS